MYPELGRLRRRALPAGCLSRRNGRSQGEQTAALAFQVAQQTVLWEHNSSAVTLGGAGSCPASSSLLLALLFQRKITRFSFLVHQSVSSKQRRGILQSKMRYHWKLEVFRIVKDVLSKKNPKPTPKTPHSNDSEDRRRTTIVLPWASNKTSKHLGGCILMTCLSTPTGFLRQIAVGGELGAVDGCRALLWSPSTWTISPRTCSSAAEQPHTQLSQQRPWCSQLRLLAAATWGCQCSCFSPFHPLLSSYVHFCMWKNTTEQWNKDKTLHFLL